MSQTTIQNPNAVRWGSGKFEAALKSSGFGALQDMGALKDITVDETWTEVTVDSHNAGRIRKRIKDQKLAIKFNWLEPDYGKLAMLRGGSLDEYNIVAGVPVIDHQQFVASGAWSYLKFIPFDRQNASGVVPSNISVSGSVNGPLVASTDYFVMKNNAGMWGLYIIDSATVTTEAQILTIEYDYTPASSVTFSTGGNRTVNPIVVRITNKDENSKNHRMDVYEVYIQKGVSFKYLSDEADDCNAIAIEAEAICDESRDPRDQLYFIDDQQAV